MNRVGLFGDPYNLTRTNKMDAVALYPWAKTS